ncbi:MAG TPA: DUF3618 domain-containing protein [Vicinamibacterales bacterium]|nr:DUF3618 domain-containing protein [Vicinamibacterales bacterium]
MGEASGKVTGETREVEAIKADIEETRAEMSETIDAIEDRLSPRRLAHEAKETIKDATVGRIGTMMNSAGGAARELAGETREMAGGLAQHMKDNSIPYALIGAGLGWLLLNGRSRQGSYGRSTRGGYYGEYYDDQWPARSDRWTEADEQSWKEGASRAQERIGQYSHRAQASLNQWVRGNPLAFGIAALAVGAAIGLSMPETDVEDEWMGDTRDNLVGRAQEMTNQAVDTIQQTISGTSESGS